MKIQDAGEMREKTSEWLAGRMIGNRWLAGTKARLTERIRKISTLTGISVSEIRAEIIADAKIKCKFSPNF